MDEESGKTRLKADSLSGRWTSFLKKLGEHEEKLEQFSKSHPVIRNLVAFVFLGLTTTIISVHVTSKDHSQDVALEIRNSAISAVSDISNLTDDRRERAALVASSIRRLAPEAEIDRRKIDYDEAYVNWNYKVPSDELLIRASLNLKYGSQFQGYIDGLTNASEIKSDMLDRPANVRAIPGLLSIMDACITDAYDEYRETRYDDNKKAVATLHACKFARMYTQVVQCFSFVSQVLYNQVGKAETRHHQDEVGDAVEALCVPPPGALQWASDPD